MKSIDPKNRGEFDTVAKPQRTLKFSLTSLFIALILILSAIITIIFILRKSDLKQETGITIQNNKIPDNVNTIESPKLDTVDTSLIEHKGNRETLTTVDTLKDPLNPPDQNTEDRRSRIVKKGVLSLLSGQQNNQSAVLDEIIGKGGFATDIDALLSGVGGLRSSAGGGIGRKGVAGIGYGAGYGSGFGGTGSEDADDLLELKKKSMNKVTPPVQNPVKTWKRSAIIPNTSKLSVGLKDSLPLKGVQIAVRIDGFRARVIMDCFYQNTYSRQLEGTFKLRLPHEASPYYFAFGQTVILDKESQQIPFEDYRKKPVSLTPEDIRYRRQTSWSNVKEARIVPREKASYAYTETTHRRVDPAIMEWAGADIFNCRVFPLQPNQLNRIVVGYDVDLQSIKDDKLLSVPVPSAQGPVCIDLDLAILSNCKPILSPSKDLFEYEGRQICHYENPQAEEISVRYPNPGPTLIFGSTTTNRSYWTASVRIDLPSSETKYTEENAVFLLDASLSSNPDNFNIWLALMNSILEKNEDVIKKFGVLFFNVETYCWKKFAVDNNDANRKDLQLFAKDQVLEGATDIYQAIAAVRSISFDGQSDRRTIFLLSDGASTWGEQEPSLIAQKLNSNDRVFCYSTGFSGTDSHMLEYLSRRNGGSLFTVSGDDQIPEAAQAFRNRTWDINHVSIDSCSDILIKGKPEHLYDRQYLTIAGRGTVPDNAELLVTISQGEEQKEIVIPFTHNIVSPLAERSYGQIATSQLEEYGSAVEKYATSYALHFTVPGQTCALLMLESERDYQRYSIHPEKDLLAVTSFPVESLLTNVLSNNTNSFTNSKNAFVSWLHKLEQLPDIGFKIGLPLELAINATPESSFIITPPVLPCSIHTKEQISASYLKQLQKGEPDYKNVIDETNRRKKAATAYDALKALSSIVECNKGNSEIMRDVGYTVMELGLDAHAYFLFRQVARNRPFEPQTYCALGQVLTQMDNADLAIIFYEIALSANWNPRYGDFKKIASLDYLHLLRSIVNGHHSVHFTDFAHERALSLSKETSDETADLMVSITWNTDNTDIDLHVYEPSGEECYYNNTNTRIGGKITHDVTTGYGPEMYILKKAPAGKYKISVQNFASNNNRTGLRTTIYTTIYKNWGKQDEKVIRKKVTLQQVKETESLIELSI